MPHFYCIWFIFCVQCHQITFFPLLECEEFLLLSVKTVSSEITNFKISIIDLLPFINTIHKRLLNST